MKTTVIGTVVENVGAWSAALVSIGFLVSVVYDGGFLFALDLSFSDIPTSIGDHFRTGLLWFPPLILLGFIYAAFEFHLQRLERGLTEDEIIKSAPDPEKLRKFRQGPYRLIAWIAPLGVLNFILIGDMAASFAPLALLILWVSFSEWTYSAPLIQQRRNVYIQTAFTVVPAIAILTFFTGYASAVSAARISPVEVALTFHEGGRVLNGRLLRSFDKGVLFLSATDSILFIDWSSIEHYRYEKSYEPRRGVLCWAFDLCPETLPGEKSISNITMEPDA